MRDVETQRERSLIKKHAGYKIVKFYGRIDKGRVKSHMSDFLALVTG